MLNEFESEYERELVLHLHYSDLSLCASIFLFVSALCVVFFTGHLFSFFVLVSLSGTLFLCYCYQSLSYWFEAMSTSVSDLKVRDVEILSENARRCDVVVV